MLSWIKWSDTQAYLKHKFCGSLFITFSQWFIKIHIVNTAEISTCKDLPVPYVCFSIADALNAEDNVANISRTQAHFMQQCILHCIFPPTAQSITNINSKDSPKIYAILSIYRVSLPSSRYVNIIKGNDSLNWFSSVKENYRGSVVLPGKSSPSDSLCSGQAYDVCWNTRISPLYCSLALKKKKIQGEILSVNLLPLFSKRISL